MPRKLTKPVTVKLARPKRKPMTQHTETIELTQWQMLAISEALSKGRVHTINEHDRIALMEMIERAQAVTVTRETDR